MNDVPDTLPKYNILEGNNLQTFWNYLESVLYLGMPFLLIALVLLLLPQVFRMIRDAVRGEDPTDDERRRRRDDDDFW